MTVHYSDAWSGSANWVVDGDTEMLAFDPPLPDRAYCTIELDCGATVCVRSLEGDVIAHTDASKISPHFGTAVTQGSAEYDVDCNGTVATTDSSMLKVVFGDSAPECP